MSWSDTWSKRLQEPRPPSAARGAVGGLGGVERSDGLDVRFVVSGRGNLQDWDHRALIQQTV